MHDKYFSIVDIRIFFPNFGKIFLPVSQVLTSPCQSSRFSVHYIWRRDKTASIARDEQKIVCNDVTSPSPRLTSLLLLQIDRSWVVRARAKHRQAESHQQRSLQLITWIQCHNNRELRKNMKMDVLFEFIAVFVPNSQFIFDKGIMG